MSRGHAESWHRTQIKHCQVPKAGAQEKDQWSLYYDTDDTNADNTSDTSLRSGRMQATHERERGELAHAGYHMEIEVGVDSPHSLGSDQGSKMR